jgi:hypothetical protein
LVVVEVVLPLVMALDLSLTSSASEEVDWYELIARGGGEKAVRMS